MSVDLVPAGYLDASRRRRTIAPGVRAAVRAAMGLGPGEEPPDASVAVVPRGSPLPVPGELVLEDGTSLGRQPRMPRDAPFGYHRLAADDGREWLLITGPGRCHLPDDLRAWGWTVQLATTRSAASWGIGDLGDLGMLGRWAADEGAGFLAVSPLGAPNPGPVPEPSPYYPSTRRFGNPLHLAIGDVPGAASPDVDAGGRALSHAPLVDRRRVWELKRTALERAWEDAAFDRPALEAWRAEQPDSLRRWATFVVLSERLGAGWRSWPARYRDPASRAVRDLASQEADRVAFHEWIQWCFDRQLRAASQPIRRIADIPVGSDPGGFDAWDWQGQLAMDATAGAPPDRFNETGQDWGLPPFVPHRLRLAGYRPFIEMLRAQLRHAGGLRIDHVLGLFRLWWLPAGHDPRDGAYVTYPTEELLEIVALESQRAGAIVIGEDLGTVPAGVRRELRRRRLLSTRLALFERRPPARWPRRALAAVTTHDLPTVAGVWSGADLADQAASGVAPDRRGLQLLRRRLARVAGVGRDAALRQLVLGLHRAVSGSPSMLVAAMLEDAVGVTTRPNLPGTGERRPANWSRPLPITIDELVDDPGVRALTEALRREPG
ncbi:MAG TPA: 4-alpha-glucanotransferase [Candidatus Limnocylindria bacterium]|nr:4-alpha-glucanotransferase [Candidatus Limnocylindria bacterium]